MLLSKKIQTRTIFNPLDIIKDYNLCTSEFAAGFNFSHPEKGEDELFLANFTKESFDSLPFLLKRLGRKAYEKTGKEIKTSREWQEYRLFPVFISKKEYSECFKKIEQKRVYKNKQKKSEENQTT